MQVLCHLLQQSMNLRYLQPHFTNEGTEIRRLSTLPSAIELGVEPRFEPRVLVLLPYHLTLHLANPYADIPQN